MQIAQTILNHIGGNKFCAMTGSKQFVAGTDFLQFAIGKGAINKANKVKIILGADDLYTVEMWKIRGVNCERLSSTAGVYADRLTAVFTEQTGMDTHI